MEYYLKQTPRTYILIKVLFGILSLIVLTFIVLLFTLRIDQKVSFTQGEIIAKNPASEFFVPYEAEVSELLVKEGTIVQVGDTLAILRNTNVQHGFASLDKELQLQAQKIVGINNQISSIQRTIQQQEKQKQLYANKHQLHQKDAQLEEHSLKQQVYAKKQSLDILKEQSLKSAQLFKKGSISKNEFEDQRQAYLAASADYNALLKQMKQANGQDALLTNDYSTTLNDFELGILSSQNAKRALQQQLQEEQIRIEQLQQQLTYQGTEVAKAYIIADKEGRIANLYNQKSDSNFLTKGVKLFAILPKEAQGFHAKVPIPQTSVKEIAIGQATQLRLEAFSFMKFGIVRGEVSFINKNEANEFYALIDITQPNPTITLKSGYAVQGDIFVKRIKLYQFVFRKLFTKG